MNTASAAARAPSAVLVVPFLLGAFFPYIQLLPTATDLQPLALFFAALIAALYAPGASVPKPLLALGLLFGASIAVLAISNLDYNSARSIANYTSFFIISVAAFVAARHPLAAGTRVADAANLIWCIVGMIQDFYDPYFLTDILSNMRTTVGRGVVSLAAEPSFYGLMCFVFLLIYFLQRRELSWWSALAVAQILFLARSPMGTAMFLLFAASYVVVSMNLRVTVVCLLAMFLATYAIIATPVLSDTRLGVLARTAIEDPGGLLVRDHSISSRFYHIYYSIKGCAMNGLLPHGYSAWAQYFYGELGGNSRRYLGWYMEAPDRIMSAIGAAFFELGGIGAFILVALFGAIKHFFGGLANRRALVFTIGIVSAMLNSVPLGFPLYGFIAGYCYAFRDTGAGLLRASRIYVLPDGFAGFMPARAAGRWR